jgi:hypothetical protein
MTPQEAIEYLRNEAALLRRVFNGMCRSDRPEHTTQVRPVAVIAEHTCDLCGKSLLEKQPYRISEVSLSMREGVTYPEGGTVTITEADVCVTCFEDVLIPAMETVGLKFRTTEVDS